MVGSFFARTFRRKVMAVFVVCYLVAFVACGVGTVSGMGGGIIIKPVIDAMGVMSVNTITFISGCTVIGMTCWSVLKTFIKKESVIDVRKTTLLAVGAAVGGIVGKQLYNLVAGGFEDKNTAGGVQAVLLFFATLFTFVYTLNKDRISAKNIKNPVAVTVIGLCLGVLGAFLGIGGGPFNVAVLYYFFSMPTKKATQNSLYIVLFSQCASIAKNVVAGNIPGFDPAILVGMIIFGIVGSELGRRLNKSINERQATYLLEGVMILIMCINLYNIFKFL